jgi:hypothetical protein
MAELDEALRRFTEQRMADRAREDAAPPIAAPAPPAPPTPEEQAAIDERRAEVARQAATSPLALRATEPVRANVQDLFPKP